MRLHKVPHPGGRRQEFTTGSSRNELQVLVDAGKRRAVAANVLQIRVAQRHETWVVATLAVHDLVHGHLFKEATLTRRSLGTSACNHLICVIRQNVIPEPKLLFVHGIDAVCPAHVLINLGNWHEEGKIKDQNCPGDNHDEGRESCVLEVGHLHLHGPELCSPADVRRVARLHRRRLPANCLPVCGLDALKVICRLLIVELLDVAFEGHQGITSEKVPHVM
mmetsp:Transcript_90786/g.163931  ORF Transcript_90786/g.163931 Transcript_90786/m.163931 type:complete len:221 (+) Transcript_90786:669-1331(+)